MQRDGDLHVEVRERDTEMCEGPVGQGCDRYARDGRRLVHVDGDEARGVIEDGNRRGTGRRAQELQRLQAIGVGLWRLRAEPIRGGMVVHHAFDDDAHERAAMRGVGGPVGGRVRAHDRRLGRSRGGRVREDGAAVGERRIRAHVHRERLSVTGVVVAMQEDEGQAHK